MSDSGAKKDAVNREKGLLRLQKRLKSGKLTKVNINNHGYNKYLKLEGEISVSINMDKYNADAAWDGLKAYKTNTRLPNSRESHTKVLGMSDKQQRLFEAVGRWR
jgi:hypothetical protein